MTSTLHAQAPCLKLLTHLWPNSWAIVNAAPSPMSRTRTQLFGSFLQMLPRLAVPVRFTWKCVKVKLIHWYCDTQKYILPTKNIVRNSYHFHWNCIQLLDWTLEYAKVATRYSTNATGYTSDIIVTKITMFITASRITYPGYCMRFLFVHISHSLWKGRQCHVRKTASPNHSTAICRRNLWECFRHC